VNNFVWEGMANQNDCLFVKYLMVAIYVLFVIASIIVISAAFWVLTNNQNNDRQHSEYQFPFDNRKVFVSKK
jgi:hypothetical protein